MIAYVILTHQDFPNTSELIARIYHPDNLYCVCVNSGSFVDALNAMNFLRVLPNLHIIPTPLTSWGQVLEAYLYGIEFCLKIDESWQSLILLTGSDMPVASQSRISAEISTVYRDKIVLLGFEAAKEFDADVEIQKRILEDPFHLNPSDKFDAAYYNPFTYTRPNNRREGTTIYLQPDSMRAGWSTTNSHFVKHLFHQSRERGTNTAYFETISPFRRKLLKNYFENKVSADGPVFGIFPRDFCKYCISDENALLYFTLIQNAYAAEESFFATLAFAGNFPARRVQRCITFAGKRQGALLAPEDLTEEVIGHHYFVRKVPAGEAGRNFCIAACEQLGIERSPKVPEFPPAGQKDYWTLLYERFQSRVNIVDTGMSCGLVGQRYLCDIVFGSDGLLHYGSDPPGMLGREWRWGEAGIEVAVDGRPFARFDGLRIHQGKLLLLGYWFHADVLTLACVADVAPMLVTPAFADLPASAYGDLAEYAWSCWFSESLVAELSFKPDGTIWTSDNLEVPAGFWRVEDGALLTFGVHSMPIALFEHRSVDKSGRHQIAGVSWGRRLPIEPCLLVSRPARLHKAIDPAKAVEADAPPSIQLGTEPISRAELTMLPGTRYARYGLPLDYPPSRDYRPRWGRTHPPIASLNEWFGGHAPRYEAFLEEMTRSLPWVATIPHDFSDDQLPEPAWFGVPFAPFDALALYTMVRLHRPRTYLEIGSGISTFFAAKAVRDHDIGTRIVSIDPQPRRAVDSICNEVIREGLEVCDLARFGELQAGDILFFDGSHRSFMNSDVTVFMIDILPNLKPGVIVHIHDISLPWDYPEMFMDWYWNEQYLLAAYMLGARERLDPMFPTKFVCNDERFAKRLARPFIDFGDPRRNFGWRGGGSMWFTHIHPELAAAKLAPIRPAQAAAPGAEAGEPDAATPGPAPVTPAAESPGDRFEEADLTRRIQFIRGLSNDDKARIGMDRVATEIQTVLDNPLFEQWPIEQQLPMIERIAEIYYGHWHASGHALIPALERLFHRALATPEVTLDTLCLFYDLLYFLYWSTGSDLDALQGFAGGIAAPFAAAIRAGIGCANLPPVAQRPLGQEPLRLGYLSQHAHLRPINAIGPFIQHILGGLSRHLTGRYRMVLYAWMDHDESCLAPLDGTEVRIRRFDAGSMTERIAAVTNAIAADEIDILITDMNSSLPTVLFERRAAPVQIFYQFGMPFWPLVNLDAIFRLDAYDPRFAEFDPAKCFTLGLGPWDMAKLAPGVSAERVAAERARFPQSARLIGFYGRLAKITPGFLEIVTDILARLPQVCVLLGGTGDGSRVRDLIADRQLSDRLIVVEEFVDGHVWGHMLEVFLDTSPMEGGLSCREVMAKGIPVVTLCATWSDRERVPMLVADDRRSYVEIVARLIEDRDYYSLAGHATGDFVAAQPGEADYAAAVDDAISTVVGWVRNQPEPAKRTRHNIALDRLVCRSVLDELRSSAPSRVAEVDFGPGAKPVEIVSVDELLYLPALHLQVWHDSVVPYEANIDSDAFPELQENICSGAVRLTCSPNDIDVLDDEVCVLSNLYSNNFGHFFEELYKVTILEHSGFRGRYVLSPYADRHSPGLARFTTEFLDLLGVRDDRIMMCRRPTVFRSAWFTTHIAHHETIAYRNVFFALRTALITAATAIAPGLGSRLFLERSAPRVLVNAKEVHECVRRYGFTVVDMAKLSVAEQIAAAHHAEVLIGTHGSGMSHCIFLKEKSTVVECFSPHFMDDFILDYCHNLHHRYFQIVATNRTGAPLEYKYGADVAINCHHLELVLKGLA